uniref:Uncharacterized protein n=1 Tax=viral metagenome TaxID=1070528 RepID=A0A6M3JAE5_9ZZZZ
MTKIQMSKMELEDRIWWQNIQSPLGFILQMAIFPLPPSEYARREETEKIMRKLVER